MLLYFIVDMTFSMSYILLKNTITLPYTLYTYFNPTKTINITQLQEDVAFTQYELNQLQQRLKNKESDDYDDYDIIYSSF